MRAPASLSGGQKRCSRIYRIIRRLAAQLRAEGEIISPNTIFETGGRLVIPPRSEADSFIANIVVGPDGEEVLSVQGEAARSWQAPVVNPQTGVLQIPEFPVPIDRQVLENGNVLYLPPAAPSVPARSEVRSL